MPRTTKPRTKQPHYEAVLNLPPVPPDQYEALRANIAVHGVLVPILVDSDGPRRKIIDGNYRKKIANELGYDCPEIVQPNLDEDEKRTLARALNLARRQLSPEQKRELIREQIQETPDRSSRWIAKMLGVSHPTVLSVRGEMQSTGKVYQLEKSLGQDGKYRPATKTTKATSRPIAEQKARIEALTLIQGDCRNELKKLPAKSVDAIITDPIYPGIAREYGSIGEEDWLTLMKEVVAQCRRVLKPKGSAVFVLQPNYEKMGRMRPWLWEFVAWAAREWNLIQDCYWWTTNAMPTCSTQRKIGLMRQSVKWCVWLGQPKCYRNQDAVLWKAAETTLLPKWSDRCLWNSPSGYTVRHGRTAQVAIERGGSTPFNLLPIPSAGADDHHGHPASTPYELASWWCRYILPPSGVLLDPFCGSGTMLAAGLDATASRVIGIDQEKQYLRMAKQRVEKG